MSDSNDHKFTYFECVKLNKTNVFIRQLEDGNTQMDAGRNGIFNTGKLSTEEGSPSRIIKLLKKKPRLELSMHLLVNYSDETKKSYFVLAGVSKKGDKIVFAAGCVEDDIAKNDGISVDDSPSLIS